MDTEGGGGGGGIKSVGIKQVKFKEKGFLSPGKNQLSVIMRCPY